MVIIDTNVLIHASDRASEQHAVCFEYLNELRKGTTAWFLSWNVIYEYIRIVTHPRVLLRPWEPTAAWQFVRALIACPSCEVLGATPRHADVLEAFLDEYPDTRGNLIHDARTVVHMHEHGVQRVCSYDRDFHRFRVDVVTP